MGKLKRRLVGAAALISALALLPLLGASAASSVPRFSHILVIIAENKEFGQVIGNSRMPNLNGWAKSHTLLSEYYAVAHPSLPNYLALIGGDYFGILEDCVNCLVKARNLADLLEAGGRTWKTYQESLPEPGFTGIAFGKYVIRHNPFVYFESIRNDPARRQRCVVPLNQLALDLEQDGLPDFSFIVPDLCNSSHDCGLEVTDAWLGQTVGSILNSAAFDGQSLLVITFDEGTTDKGGRASSAASGGGKVATILISPLVKPGFRDKTTYSHYSLLRTIAASWGLEELGRAADPSTNLILLPWKDGITRQ